MAASSLPPQSNRVTFARSLGCFDASMIGIGAMIGAGIFVLTGIAAGEAGPASILAFALNGLVTLMTAFCYAELASAIPEAGGGYSFVKKAFPGPVGFLSGWMLWFAYTVACSLYALGFAGYFWEFFHKYLPDVSYTIQATTGVQPSVAFVTVIVSCVFVWLNVRGTEVTGKAVQDSRAAGFRLVRAGAYLRDARTGGEELLSVLPEGTGGRAGCNGTDVYRF